MNHAEVRDAAHRIRQSAGVVGRRQAGAATCRQDRRLIRLADAQQPWRHLIDPVSDAAFAFARCSTFDAIALAADLLLDTTAPRRIESAMPGDSENLESALEAVPETQLPRRILATYTRLWQFETWLRQMVYVELRAAFGNNWEQEIARQPTRSVTADRRLTHMPTPELHSLSFISFSQLQDTIVDHWSLFNAYLPPRDIWNAKLEEVSQIRNRVAHFRLGHSDDLERVIRLMRDVDQGFWKFCSSYNSSSPVLPPSRDPVINRFHDLDQFPYAKVGNRTWARVGIADPNAIVTVTVDVLRRPWQTNRRGGRVSGQAGYLYNVVIIARGRRSFGYPRYLEDTKRSHSHLVHICLDSSNASVRATIPAVLGARTVNKTIQSLIDWAPSALRRSGDNGDSTIEVERTAGSWPEYVLGPQNPLCFLDPDMPCSFFTI